MSLEPPRKGWEPEVKATESGKLGPSHTRYVTYLAQVSANICLTIHSMEPARGYLKAVEFHFYVRHTDVFPALTV